VLYYCTVLGNGRVPELVMMFRPGLAPKPRLWLGLRWLWPAQDLGQAKAATHGLALAWPGPGHGFWHVESFWTVKGWGSKK
jgi:hypothetical protein